MLDRPTPRRKLPRSDTSPVVTLKVAMGFSYTVPLPSRMLPRWTERAKNERLR